MVEHLVIAIEEQMRAGDDVRPTSDGPDRDRRSQCIGCHGPLPDDGRRFCSNECAARWSEKGVDVDKPVVSRADEDELAIAQVEFEEYPWETIPE